MRRLALAGRMDNSIPVRPAVAGDVPALAAIAAEAGLFPADMLPDMIAAYLDGGTTDLWLAATLADDPVGFAFCEAERMTRGTWNLLAIGVLPAHQNAGIGTGLVNALEDVLRRDAQRLLLVETLGTPDFARTRAFYAARGFIEEARIHDFYDDGGDKLVFRKRL